MQSDDYLFCQRFYCLIELHVPEQPRSGGMCRTAAAREATDPYKAPVRPCTTEPQGFRSSILRIRSSKPSDHGQACSLTVSPTCDLSGWDACFQTISRATNTIPVTVVLRGSPSMWRLLR